MNFSKTEIDLIKPARLKVTHGILDVNLTVIRNALDRFWMLEWKKLGSSVKNDDRRHVVVDDRRATTLVPNDLFFDVFSEFALTPVPISCSALSFRYFFGAAGYNQ